MTIARNIKDNLVKAYLYVNKISFISPEKLR